MRNLSQVRKLFSRKGANGWSNPINVSGYRHQVLVISTTGNAAGTIKIAGSPLKGDDIDFTTSAGVGNEWDYIAHYNYQDPTSVVAGDTGLVYSGTDTVEQLLINVDHVNTLAVELSGYSAGEFTVQFIGANDTKQ